MAAPFPLQPQNGTRTHTNPCLRLRPELSAKGKTVLITGGGSGIGAETAAYFAEAGASRIGLLGRREQPLMDTKDSLKQKFPELDVFIAPTDVTEKKQVDAAFETFLGDGKLHVLVSNAATTGPHDGVENVDSEAFMKGINQNLRGSLLVAQAFLRYASPDAVVIETNSSAAHLTFGPKFAAYSVAKLAIYRLWDFLAAEKPNLSVFHVQPGVVDTAMNKEAGGVAALGIEDHVSLPASFYVWLASPEAQFLKGKFLWANWDIDDLKAKAKEIEAGSYLGIGLVGWPFQQEDWKLQANFLNAVAELRLPGGFELTRRATCCDLAETGGWRDRLYLHCLANAKPIISLALAQPKCTLCFFYIT